MELVEENTNGVIDMDNLIVKLSMDMFNRKYKIKCNDVLNSTHIKNIHPKDFRFYNKRLLHLFKSLLVKGQSNKKMDDIDNYITNIPSEIVEMGDEFITQCILFFKREDTNELIQQDLIESIENVEYCEDRSEVIMGTSYEYDKQLYKSSHPQNSGVFEIESDTNEDCKMIPIKRDFNLRDNRLRLKGITKNNNMTILYEEDETKR